MDFKFGLQLPSVKRIRVDRLLRSFSALWGLDDSGIDRAGGCAGQGAQSYRGS